MAVLVLKDVSMFKHYADGDNPVVVLASATWCGPCKAIKPRYLKMAEEYKDVMFFTFDVDEQQELAEFFEISAMPTFIVVHERILVKRQEGADILAIVHVLNNLRSSSSGAPPPVEESSTIAPSGSFDNYALV
jgi:thiol-disulfide isomerase/thioredoxin